MDWRQQQLAAFSEPVILKQDHDLLEFCKKQGYSEAIGYGDCAYFQSALTFTDRAPLLVAIVNHKFNFVDLAAEINALIPNVTTGGFVYLAINKYLAIPGLYGDYHHDYDLAIREFVEQNIRAKIVSYEFVANDSGEYFNFAHPVTRFYLQV